MRDPTRGRWTRAAALPLLLAAGCAREPADPREAELRSAIVAFLEAAARGDSAGLAARSLDERALSDAALLRSDHGRLLLDPEGWTSRPYHVKVAGDTAFVFLAALRREYSAELRRTGGGWKIVRTGFPP